MSRKEATILAALMVISVILAFGSGYLFNDMLDRRNEPLPILMQAYELLNQHAYNPIPAEPTLEYGMIRGMVAAYGDPFTTFVEPARNELQSDELQGVYGGIGVSLERNNEGQVLLYPFPDGPAQNAGLQDADVLIAVDERTITPETTMDEITSAIRGPEGTEVVIIVQRLSTPDPLTFRIDRVPVPLPSVTWKLSPDEPAIGLIEVNLIADTTPDEIAHAAEDLRSQGAGYFVLDLRDNGGGLLKAGVDCARLFLRDGVIIEQQYRGKQVDSFDVKEPGALSDLPLVVWVNQNTASAAEIFAGALQQSERSPLIGTHTFGKDAIQLVFELEDGSSIHVTAAKWWFPNLTFPNDGVGLLPDIDVAGDAADYIAATRSFFDLPDE